MKNCASGRRVISAAAASVRWGPEVRPLGGRRDPGTSIGRLADNERWMGHHRRRRRLLRKIIYIFICCVCVCVFVMVIIIYVTRVFYNYIQAESYYTSRRMCVEMH